MNDFIGSFEAFLQKENPNVCLACWGEGRLIEVLPITGFRHDIECPNCRGTGNIHERQNAQALPRC